MSRVIHGEESESHDVTPEVLAEIISSPDFLKVLHEAVQAGIQTGHETGFSIGLKKEEPVIGKVFGAAEVWHIDISEQESRINSHFGQLSLGDYFWRKNIQLLLDTHFHTGLSVEPSPEDLACIFETRKYMLEVAGHDVYPIMAITAQAGEHSGQDVAVLLIQEKSGPKPPTKTRGQMINNLKENLFMELFGSSRTEISPQETLELLQKIPGLNVALITYQYEGTGVAKKLTCLQSKEEIAEMLKAFAFQPKRVLKEE